MLYNTEPAETDTPIHRAVNQCAAMEQMCLLHNTGILPLQLQKGQKVAVIGPLGAENYRDWYTGVASYGVNIRDGLRQRLGTEQVLFDDGYDVVAVQSVLTGKYCTVAEDGTLYASAAEIGERERFRCHDWDFGSMNLYACCNDRYVTEDGAYRATSATPYSWFIREWLKPEPYGDTTLFGSWQDIPMDVAVQPDGTLHAFPMPGRMPHGSSGWFPWRTAQHGLRRWRSRRMRWCSVWEITPCRWHGSATTVPIWNCRHIRKS